MKIITDIKGSMQTISNKIVILNITETDKSTYDIKKSYKQKILEKLISTIKIKLKQSDKI